VPGGIPLPVRLALLRRFPSPAQLMNATVATLKEVPNVTAAQAAQLYQHFSNASLETPSPSVNAGHLLIYDCIFSYFLSLIARFASSRLDSVAAVVAVVRCVQSCDVMFVCVCVRACWGGNYARACEWGVSVSDRDLLLVHVRGYGADDQRLSIILLLQCHILSYMTTYYCAFQYITYDNIPYYSIYHIHNNRRSKSEHMERIAA